MFVIQTAIQLSVYKIKETVRMFVSVQMHGLVTDHVIRCVTSHFASMMVVIVLKKSAVLDADRQCWQMAFVIMSAIQNCAVWTKETVEVFPPVLAAKTFKEMACATKIVTFQLVCTTMETVPDK